MGERELLERIDRAPVYDVAIETPLDEAKLLSNQLGNRVWIKREDLQPASPSNFGVPTIKLSN